MVFHALLYLISTALSSLKLVSYMMVWTRPDGRRVEVRTIDECWLISTFPCFLARGGKRGEIYSIGYIC